MEASQLLHYSNNLCSYIWSMKLLFRRIKSKAHFFRAGVWNEDHCNKQNSSYDNFRWGAGCETQSFGRIEPSFIPKRMLMNPSCSEKVISRTFLTESRVQGFGQIHMVSGPVSHKSLILDPLVYRGCISYKMNINWWSKAMRYKNRILKQTRDCLKSLITLELMECPRKLVHWRKDNLGDSHHQLTLLDLVAIQALFTSHHC